MGRGGARTDDPGVRATAPGGGTPDRGAARRRAGLPVYRLHERSRRRARGGAQDERDLHRGAPVMRVLLALLAVLSPGGAAVSELIRVDSLVQVPMRDGVKLYADVYRPRREGKFPVLVVRTPYGVQRDGMHETKIRFARRGYAVVVE